MAASLNATATLATDPLFRQRVQAAMVTAALNVAAEAVGGQDTNTYGQRHALAVEVLNNPGSYLDRFSWAVAANTTVSGDVGLPISITASTAVNPAVITTISAHGYSTGDWVKISGEPVNTVINGIWPVTTILTTTFSIPVLGSSAGTTGAVCVKHPPDSDIQFAVNSDWSDIAGVGVTT
jgi:hypothetical protein